MRDTTGIHRGGRPRKVRPAGFWELILSEYEHMTIRQIAASHNVSKSTVNSWLAEARRRRQAEEATTNGAES